MKKFEIMVCVAIVLIIGSTIYLNSGYVNVKESSCTVTDKESVTVKGTNQYRVYTTCGTFAVRDDLTRLRFDSADVYGSLVTGSTYTIKSSGFRIGLFSMFPNIVTFRTEK